MFELFFMNESKETCGMLIMKFGIIKYLLSSYNGMGETRIWI